MRGRLTYANVMATIAVFIALGGSAVAGVTLGKYDVKGSNIAPNAVQSPKVKNGSLLARDLRPGQVPHAYGTFDIVSEKIVVEDGSLNIEPGSVRSGKGLYCI